MFLRSTKEVVFLLFTLPPSFCTSITFFIIVAFPFHSVFVIKAS